MLSDAHYQLLTAFVDGELSRRQRQLALQLLSESSEARHFLRELQEDANRVRGMPRRSLGADFSHSVMTAIADQELPAPTFPLRTNPPAKLPWFRVAMAAAVVMAVALGTYLIFFGGSRPAVIPDRQPIAKPNPLPNKELSLERFSLTTLQKPKLQRQFTQNIEKKFVPQKGVRLEMPYSNGKNAIELLVSAFSDNGIDVILPDLRKTNSETEFVVFAENIKPKDLTQILIELAGDQQPNKKDMQFDNVAVTALDGDHRGDLAKMMNINGVDARFLEPDAAKPLPSSIFQKKLIDGGKGVVGPAPKENPKTKPKKHLPKRFALVLANRNVGNDRSKIISFLNHRAQYQAGTVQLVLVLRPKQTA